MRLIDSNIVLVGGFNPNIIVPAWLNRQKVVDERPDEVLVETLFEHGISQFSPGAPKMIRFKLDGERWEVSFDRVLIGSNTAQSPADKFTKLLELLPHTPVRAVGINFKLRCDRTSWKSDVPQLPNQDRAQNLVGKVISSTAVTRGSLDDGTQINLTLSATEAEVTLDANFHKGLKRSDAETAKDTIAEAIKNFDAHWNRLRSIVRLVAGQEATQ